MKRRRPKSRPCGKQARRQNSRKGCGMPWSIYFVEIVTKALTVSFSTRIDFGTAGRWGCLIWLWFEAHLNIYAGLRGRMEAGWSRMNGKFSVQSKHTRHQICWRIFGSDLIIIQASQVIHFCDPVFKSNLAITGIVSVRLENGWRRAVQRRRCRTRPSP